MYNVYRIHYTLYNIHYKAYSIQLGCQCYPELQSDLYYPRYLGVLNFGLKTADKRGPRIIEVQIIEVWLYFI